jgi:hypothetical protein
MAHLWCENPTQDWEVVHLAQARLLLEPQGARPHAEFDAAVASHDAVLCRVNAGESEPWLLITRPDARVRLNGAPVALGIVALRDRDAILVSDERGAFRRFYFSTERLAAVRPLPHDMAGAFCPRCKQAIRPDSPAVECPACGVWHHESGERNCWTYAANCAACQSQPTDLDTGYRWTPMEL